MQPTDDELKILLTAREIATAVSRQCGTSALAVLAGALRELILRQHVPPHEAEAVLQQLGEAVRNDHNPRWKEVN